MANKTAEGLQAYRIDWIESEAGCGSRPDGYSLHSSLEAAGAYLAGIREKLPAEVPAEYDAPSKGWREAALAVAVAVPADSLLAKELAKDGSVRVFRAFDGDLGQLYREAKSLTLTGPVVSVDYGQTPYTAQDIAHRGVARARIERNGLGLQCLASTLG